MNRRLFCLVCALVTFGFAAPVWAEGPEAFVKAKQEELINILRAGGPDEDKKVEAIFNTHLLVRRSALVGVGPRGAQTPIVIVEPSTPFIEDHALDFEIVPYLDLAKELLTLAAANPNSAPVKQILFYPLLPVDVRHNAKINREALAAQAPELMRREPSVSDVRPPASRLQPPA